MSRNVADQPTSPALARWLRLGLALWLGWIIVIGLLAWSLLHERKTPVLQTNLLALLPASERNPWAEKAIQHLSGVTSNRVIWLLQGASLAETATAARSFAKQLAESPTMASVVVAADDRGLQAVRDWESALQFRFVEAADLAAWPAGPGRGAEQEAWLMDRVQARLISPMFHPLALKLTQDPFGFLRSWPQTLPLAKSRLQVEDGVMVVRSSDPAAPVGVLVFGTLAGSAFDAEVAASVIERVRVAEAQLHGVRLLRAGTVFHAHAARTQAQADVDLIGLGSLVGILLMLYGVFRSFRPLAGAVITVGVGIATAFLLTLWRYGEVHILTLVFGASLIGEAVDYAIQYFAAHLDEAERWQPVSALRRLLPGLAVALATSLIGYTALYLSPFAALSQIAWFAMTGLIAAWCGVLGFLPRFLRRPVPVARPQVGAWQARWLAWWQTPRASRFSWGLAAALLLVGVSGCLRLVPQDDVKALVARDPDLQRQEQRIKSLTGLDFGNPFWLVTAASAEQLLMREEALRQGLDRAVAQGQLSSYQAVSTFVPSPARQAQAQAFWSESVLSPPGRLERVLDEVGMTPEVAQSLRAAFAQDRLSPLGDAERGLNQWMQAPVSLPFRHLLLGQQSEPGQAAVWVSVVVPMGVQPSFDPTSVVDEAAGQAWVDKGASVGKMLGHYREQSVSWLALAFALIAGLLAVRYGVRTAFAIALPTFLALVLSLGLQAWLGWTVNLFTYMALMLVLGVGINYSIFLHEGGRTRPIILVGVQLSAATTLLSFGLLALSSVAVLAGFGLSLTLGVALAVLLSPMTLSLTRPTAPRASEEA